MTTTAKLPLMPGREDTPLIAQARSEISLNFAGLAQGDRENFAMHLHGARMYVGGYLGALLQQRLISKEAWRLLEAEKDQAAEAAKAAAES